MGLVIQTALEDRMLRDPLTVYADYDLRVRDLIGRVTRDEVNDAARRTLAPERAALAIAGPYEEPAGASTG